MDKADPANRGVSISTKGKRAFRFTEVKDFEQLVTKLQIKCNTTSNPQHIISTEVTVHRILISYYLFLGIRFSSLTMSASPLDYSLSFSIFFKSRFHFLLSDPSHSSLI